MSPHGWIPSTFDGRDRPFRAVPGGAPAPARASLEHPFRARDQGAVPCCVSVAVVTAMEVLDQQSPPAAELSPLFHYYVSRRDPERIEVTDFRTALQAAVTTGVASASHHAPAFDEAGAREAPLREAFEDAERRRLVGWDPARRRMQYEVLEGQDVVEQCRVAIASGAPLLVGFWATSAYAALFEGARGSFGHIHGPPPRETSSDGHAVVALGYDDEKRALRIKDSRGERFADAGSWWMPYDLVEAPLVHEIWALRKITYD
jgi:hypothetical protein